MEREILSDDTAETSYKNLIRQNVFGNSEKPLKVNNHCVVLCKKVAPNVFDIRKGVAVVGGAKNLFNDGICMVAHSTKVVFVFE